MTNTPADAKEDMFKARNFDTLEAAYYQISKERDDLQRQLADLTGKLAEAGKVVDKAQHAADYYRSAILQRTQTHMPPFLPKVVRLPKAVRGDGPFANRIAEAGQYAADCNMWGAVSVMATDGKLLGCRLDEFEVVDWEPNPHLEAADAGRGKA